MKLSEVKTINQLRRYLGSLDDNQLLSLTYSMSTGSWGQVDSYNKQADDYEAKDNDGIAKLLREMAEDAKIKARGWGDVGESIYDELHPKDGEAAA